MTREDFDSGRLGIGIVTYNSMPALQMYFAGQVDVARALSIPLAVIDNCSADGSAEYVRHYARDHPQVTLIRNEGNVGYAAAVNRLFSELAPRDMMLLNPDVELRDPAPVRRLYSALRASRNTGVIAPRLLNRDASTQASARPFPSLLGMAGHASAARRLPIAQRAAERYLQHPPIDAPSRVDWAIGAAMLVRREAFEAVGGFDEGFFLYLEDTDFCLRCARAGWETWYDPGVALYHLHDRASDPQNGGVLRSRARRHHVSSIVRFFLRYPPLAVGRRPGHRSRPAAGCA